MEGERRRLIHPELTRSLRDFAGTKSASAAMSRTLPPTFSSESLLAELGEIRRKTGSGRLVERMLGPPRFGPDATVTESRRREWSLSRLVLVSAFRDLPGPNYQYSLTHSAEAALAVVVSGDQIPSIGVDLEVASREISDAAFARFSSPSEAPFGVSRVDHWVLKEACFKAHPRSEETIVADYAILGQTTDGLFTVGCRKGEPVEFRAMVGTVDEFRYAFASRSSA